MRGRKRIGRRGMRSSERGTAAQNKAERKQATFYDATTHFSSREIRVVVVCWGAGRSGKEGHTGRKKEGYIERKGDTHYDHTISSNAFRGHRGRPSPKTHQFLKMGVDTALFFCFFFLAFLRKFVV